MTTTEEQLTSNNEDFSNASTGITSNFSSTSFLFGNSVTLDGTSVISNSGNGSGSKGIFNSNQSPVATSKFILFTASNLDITDIRQITSIDIGSLLAKVTSFSFYYIEGNDSNGGETTGSSEDLQLVLLDSNNNEISGSPITIESGGSPFTSSWTLFSANSTQINNLRNASKIRFRESISAASGFYSGLTHYGIKSITIEITVNTTINVIKPLKSTKYNYISTINPKTISQISGNITNLAGTQIVSNQDSRLIMDFFIKPCL